MPHMVVHLKLISRMIGWLDIVNLRKVCLAFYFRLFVYCFVDILTFLTIVLIIYSCMLIMNFWLCLHRTLTTPVQLIKCLKSIKNHVFYSF
ncbi:hypothetical protein Hanom_Chr00s162891g01825811 [Helianthus anomalus]